MPKIHKVLVIDDELIVREITSTSLEKLGLEVTQAKNGQQGLEKARQEIPDLIFLDYMMPGMSGMEVAIALKQDAALAQIPIVMLSGKAESSDIQKAKEIGINHYLEKPADPKKIMNFVREEFLQDT